MKELRLGIIGLDTSHATAFTSILNDKNHAHYIEGARVVAAFPGGSADFPPSSNRIAALTQTIREAGVPIVSGIDELKGNCDAILLESVDGRVHLEQFAQVADWGLPVFIDKPLTVKLSEAEEILRLANKHGTRVITASALRYAQSLCQTLEKGTADGPVTGGDFYGPMAIEPLAPGFFWYGIHSVEMLFAAMGSEWTQVQAERHGDYDLIRAWRPDGSFATVRGNRTGNNLFGGVIHRKTNSLHFDISTSTEPYYVSLLKQVVPFFAGAPAPVSLEESVRVIAFLEAANTSVETGKPVRLG